MATTIVNTPASGNGSDGNLMGLLIGVVVLVTVVGFLFYFALPALKGMGSKDVQINVPKDINVEVQQAPQQ